ncbi:hypothetical protein [Acinetobacter radioresistens]|uniref:hypothetical protein n=1 Tax=Acinetobacter radioresistens TaxID=40216 RepID=UPI00200404C6|nr:hypothetical protein [Acinetobacter radioresistens]MCK4081356.1 hypothetical protein [Acinetobacter radioresistens]
MNLIEQLGGYEAAKSKCDRANKEGYLLLSVPVQNGFGDIYVYKVEAALLEYRRQHNIFEAGDVAVSVDGEPYLHKVELGTLKAHCIKIFSHDMAHSYWVHDVNYRHATDEEIKAGKRLGLTNGKI